MDSGYSHEQANSGFSHDVESKPNPLSTQSTADAMHEPDLEPEVTEARERKYDIHHTVRLNISGTSFEVGIKMHYIYVLYCI